MQAHQALFDHCLEVIFSKKKSNQSLSLKEALTASTAEVAETCRDDGDIYRAHTIFLAAVESVNLEYADVHEPGILILAAILGFTGKVCVMLFAHKCCDYARNDRVFSPGTDNQDRGP